MVTLEVTFINTAAATVEICLNPRANYLIDETTAARRNPKHQSHDHTYGSCPHLAPDERLVTWSKFLFEDEVPTVLTAVVGVARPFEGLRFAQN